MFEATTPIEIPATSAAEDSNLTKD